MFEEWRGIAVGDLVIVDGRHRHPGRVVSIASNRLSGGVYVHVVFSDGSRVSCRPRELQRVIEPAGAAGASPDNG